MKDEVAIELFKVWISLNKELYEGYSKEKLIDEWKHFKGVIIDSQSPTKAFSTKI